METPWEMNLCRWLSVGNMLHKLPSLFFFVSANQNDTWHLYCSVPSKIVGAKIVIVKVSWSRSRRITHPTTSTSCPCRPCGSMRSYFLLPSAFVQFFYFFLPPNWVIDQFGWVGRVYPVWHGSQWADLLATFGRELLKTVQRFTLSRNRSPNITFCLLITMALGWWKDLREATDPHTRF